MDNKKIKKIKWQLFHFNKKGEIAFNTLIFVFYRMVVLLFVTLMLWVFVSYFVKINIDIDKVEAEVFMQGLINSPNGLSYVNPVTNRLYPGVIDFSNYNSGKIQDQLNQAFYFTENNYIAAQIHLLDLNGNPYSSIEPKYYNEKEKFRMWYGLGNAGFSGQGSAKVFEKVYPVIILNNQKKENGLLKIIVAIPNS